MKLMGWIDWDVTKLTDYCRAVSEATGVQIPDHYPLVGKYAFETATGVHAAAVIKALKKGDRWLADRMYSGVPAEEFGMEQKIRVGPMSGKSNCIYWLEKHRIQPTDELVQRLYHAAKAADRLLTDDELMAIVKGANA
jgi:2-isopropylmalate synthase